MRRLITIAYVAFMVAVAVACVAFLIGVVVFVEFGTPPVLEPPAIVAPVATKRSKRELHVTHKQPKPPSGEATAKVLAPPAAPWDLEYSCDTVRRYNNQYSHTELEAMRIAANRPKPTRHQLTEIDECLARK